MDATQKKNFLMHIENATLDFRKERRRLLNKGVSASACVLLCTVG